jgi:hypothetical protein
MIYSYSVFQTRLALEENLAQATSDINNLRQCNTQLASEIDDMRNKVVHNRKYYDEILLSVEQHHVNRYEQMEYRYQMLLHNMSSTIGRCSHDLGFPKAARETTTAHLSEKLKVQGIKPKNSQFGRHLNNLPMSHVIASKSAINNTRTTPFSGMLQVHGIKPKPRPLVCKTVGSACATSKEQSNCVDEGGILLKNNLASKGVRPKTFLGLTGNDAQAKDTNHSVHIQAAFNDENFDPLLTTQSNRKLYTLSDETNRVSLVPTDSATLKQNTPRSSLVKAAGGRKGLADSLKKIRVNQLRATVDQDTVNI